MKRELMIICILFFLIPFGHAVEYKCTDGGEISFGREEISEGKSENVQGLNIGLVRAEETYAVGRISAEFIVDAKSVKISGANMSEEIEISTGLYNLTLVSATSSSASIKIGSSTKTIETGDFDSVGGLEVYLYESSSNEATIISGHSRDNLYSPDKTHKIISAGGIDYGIELFSASDNEAILDVSKCTEGDIFEAETETTIIINESKKNETNSNMSTANQSQNNVSIVNRTILISNQTKCVPRTLEGDFYCNSQGFQSVLKEEGSSCAEGYECESKLCEENLCKKIGLFKRIGNFFKSLFD